MFVGSVDVIRLCLQQGISRVIITVFITCFHISENAQSYSMFLLYCLDNKGKGEGLPVTYHWRHRVCSRGVALRMLNLSFRLWWVVSAVSRLLY